MKRMIAAALALYILVCTAAYPVAAVPDAPAGYYVYAERDTYVRRDTAELFYRSSYGLFRFCGVQIAVIAVDTLGYGVLEECKAIWDAEADQSCRGVLFVMEIAEGSYWTVAGGGLENTVTGQLLEDIYKDGVAEAFSAEDYDRAAAVFCEKMTEHLRHLYRIYSEQWDKTLEQLDRNDTAIPAPASSNSLLYPAVGIIILLVFLIGLHKFRKHHDM